jgi:uncharacterized membrane protein
VSGGLQIIDQHNRRWRNWCVVAGVVIHLILFCEVVRQTFTLAFTDYETVFEIFIGLIFLSIPITLFLVAIPSRVAMNLMIKDRRYLKWKETLILVLTFIALGWKFYTMAT